VTGAAPAALLALALASAGTPPWGTAVLEDGSAFTLEVAETDAARARGYMGRGEVGPREGMLFVFQEPGRHSFWMKNCLVPLDIVWLDDAFRVVHVAEKQTPCPADGPCPSIVPLRPARYALEFASGTARRHGLRPGSRVDVLRPDGAPW
jgi:uncharacterized membrane protein (UPF0127 family)